VERDERDMKDTRDTSDGDVVGFGFVAYVPYVPCFSSLKRVTKPVSNGLKIFLFSVLTLLGEVWYCMRPFPNYQRQQKPKGKEGSKRVGKVSDDSRPTRQERKGLRPTMGNGGHGNGRASFFEN